MDDSPLLLSIEGTTDGATGVEVTACSFKCIPRARRIILLFRQYIHEALFLDEDQISTIRRQIIIPFF